MNRQLGQASIEASIVLLVLVIVGIGGTSVMLNAFGKVLLTKWAAQNSRCVAATNDESLCEARTRHELRKYFAFKKIDIHEHIAGGIVSTRLSARLLHNHLMEVHYDLEPSEYKRVGP